MKAQETFQTLYYLSYLQYWTLVSALLDTCHICSIGHVVSAVLDIVVHSFFLGVLPKTFPLPFFGCAFLLYLLDFSFSICPLNGDVPYGFVLCLISSYVFCLGTLIRSRTLPLIYASIISVSSSGSSSVYMRLSQCVCALGTSNLSCVQLLKLSLL